MKRITRIAENNITQRLHKKLRVAAYCRVSTDSEEQLDSLEAQKKHYEVYIKANPDWWYAGIYVDEGISGTKKKTTGASSADDRLQAEKGGLHRHQVHQPICQKYHRLPGIGTATAGYGSVYLF